METRDNLGSTMGVNDATRELKEAYVDDEFINVIVDDNIS